MPDEKECTLCHERKPATRKYFPAHKLTRDGLNSRCIVCARAVSKAWYHAHKHEPEVKAAVRVRSRDWHRDHIETKLANYHAKRRSVLLHYSNGEMKCACCGEAEYGFLSLDHIHGEGGKHRKEIGPGPQYWRWFEKNNFPEGYQVLCYNCNLAREHQGECPHERERRLRSPEDPATL